MRLALAAFIASRMILVALVWSILGDRAPSDRRFCGTRRFGAARHGVAGENSD